MNPEKPEDYHHDVPTDANEPIAGARQEDLRAEIEEDSGVCAPEGYVGPSTDDVCDPPFEIADAPPFVESAPDNTGMVGPLAGLIGKHFLEKESGPIGDAKEGIAPEDILAAYERELAEVDTTVEVTEVWTVGPDGEIVEQEVPSDEVRYGGRELQVGEIVCLQPEVEPNGLWGAPAPAETRPSTDLSERDTLYIRSDAVPISVDSLGAACSRYPYESVALRAQLSGNENMPSVVVTFSRPDIGEGAIAHLDNQPDLSAHMASRLGQLYARMPGLDHPDTIIKIFMPDTLSADTSTNHLEWQLLERLSSTLRRMGLEDTAGEPYTVQSLPHNAIVQLDTASGTILARSSRGLEFYWEGPGPAPQQDTREPRA